MVMEAILLDDPAHWLNIGYPKVIHLIRYSDCPEAPYSKVFPDHAAF